MSNVKNGFTLVELVVVLAISGMLGAIGFASFSSYSRSQEVGSAVREVTTVLSIAKSRAQTQVKPDSCTPFQGYRVDICVPDCSSKTYTLSAVCQGASVMAETKTLPQNVSFDSSSTSIGCSILFLPLAAGVAGCQNIGVTGNGITKTIRVDSVGNISGE